MTTTPSEVEAVARALCLNDDEQPDKICHADYDRFSRYFCGDMHGLPAWKAWEDEARVAIAALDQARKG